MKILRALLFISTILYLTSCASLTPVITLSTKSTNSLLLFEELPLTYLQFCEERCQFNLIRKNQVLRDSAINCDCKVYEQADKATDRVQRALTAYFKNLGELSANDLTTFKTKSLSDALAEGQFATLSIDKKTTNAYGELAKVVITAFTEGYRKRKIKTVIERANASIQILIPVLQTSMSNLESELAFQKERNYVLHNELMMEKSGAYEKVKLGNDYYTQVNLINNKQAKLRAYSRSLTTIANGHQKLYDNRSKLTSKEIRETLADYSSALDDLLIDFKKL